MASLSDAALLEQTRLAIDALTSGGAASYSINGRSVTKNDLDKLWQQVNRLEARIRAATAGGSATVVRFQSAR
jgi:hypothetical protein